MDQTMYPTYMEPSQSRNIYWNYYDPLTGTLMRQINNCIGSRLIDGTELAYGTANSTILGPALRARLATCIVGT